jgi:hypothetical protein
MRNLLKMRTGFASVRKTPSNEAFARRVEAVREQYGSLSAYLHNHKPAASPNRPSRFVRINTRKLVAP